MIDSAIVAILFYACIPVMNNAGIEIMNQDQVIEKLLKLDNSVEDFVLTFSGKESKKVDGLYKPDNREIIIHNKNHESDNALMYTAIHEFAHHIHFTTSVAPISSRCHNSHFWNIFHKLLGKAEEMGVYTNIFETEDEFKNLTERIRGQYLHENARLMKEFGEILMQAYELCLKYHASFEDYVDRVLGLHRSSAKAIMKFHTKDISDEVGYENMKILAGIRDDDVRQLAQEAFLEGQSPDMVKAQYASRAVPDDKLEYLVKERDRLEKSLETITVKLVKVEREIQTIKEKI